MKSFFTSPSPPVGLPTTPDARQREVETALLVQALCGHSPSPAAQAQLQRYVAGELSREQAFASLYAEL